MDAAKPKNSLNGKAVSTLSAEEALKKYYDRMNELDKKLKEDLEAQRLKRQGILPEKNEDSDDANTMQEQGPSEATIAGEVMLKGMFEKR